MKLNNIYVTFNGEVNKDGIGSPCIFLRLQGCHLRCYLKTIGVLCDTPEGLKKPDEGDNIFDIFAEVEQVSKNTGLKLVTLTGGDPLWNKEQEVRELLNLLSVNGFTVNVETSGTISWLPYRHIKNVHWIIDYKGKSAGVKQQNLSLDFNHFKSLDKNDFIKFVIYDREDFEECKTAVGLLKGLGVSTNIAVGTYWGGKIEPLELFNLLKENNMLPYVTMNFQVHKMAVSSNYKTEIPTDI